MASHRERMKDKEDEYISPFEGLEKSVVLQNARVFHESPISAKRCIPILTQILYIIHQGDTILPAEATEVFFAMTKLFQSNDIALRRMLYLVIKELPVPAEDVIIVNSCLNKDMTSKNEVYVANALRVLCGVLDAAMLGQTERYIKQAIVDNNAYISSAALVSSVHLMSLSSDIVKRWVAEVQEAVQSKNTMVQYHALGLLYKIKKHDRLAVTRLVTQFTRSSLRSPYAHCLLVRICAKIITEDPNADRSLFEYLEVCLRHKSEMVIYEAARAICSIAVASDRELSPAITVLQLFLGSPKSTLRFAAVRTLSQVAMTHPMAVTTCNIDLENLITDPNRSIATLAITTLLKTGSASSIDRLMKQITEFMSEIPDEFKIVVVEAIRALCLKFPEKHRVLMSFLSSVLREEGGFEYKRTIVDTIVSLIESLPEARSPGLDHLCEFIEDCEYPLLMTRVLHLLGVEGPKTPHPAKYVRYIFNRIILESATVRAAAVSALTRFGVLVPTLQNDITVLLRRCLFDSDDEVRDRVTLSLAVLNAPADDPPPLSLFEESMISLDALQERLIDYQAEKSAVPFDLKSVPIELPKKEVTNDESGLSAAANKKARKDPNAVYTAMLAQVPEFAAYGKPYRTSKPTMCTETESDYVVKCIKHTYSDHMVFQYIVENTLDVQKITNVVVVMEEEDDDDDECEPMTQESVVPAGEITYGNTGVAYVSFALPEDEFAVPAFGLRLEFQGIDVDPSTGEEESAPYGDEYEIDGIEVSMADYMQMSVVPSFPEMWDKLATDGEVPEIFSLTAVQTLSEAVNAILDVLGMAVVDESDDVKDGATSHTLVTSGLFAGKIPALARTRLKVDATQTITMELLVRSVDPDVSALLQGVVA